MKLCIVFWPTTDNDSWDPILVDQVKDKLIHCFKHVLKYYVFFWNQFDSNDVLKGHPWGVVPGGHPCFLLLDIPL